MAFNYQGNQMPMGQGGMMPGGMMGNMMPGGMTAGGMFPMHPPMPPHPPQVAPAPPSVDQSSLNPAVNDKPLEFNQNKNKPPLPVLGESIDLTGNERERHRKRDSRGGRGGRYSQDWKHRDNGNGNKDNSSLSDKGLSGNEGQTENDGSSESGGSGMGGMGVGGAMGGPGGMGGPAMGPMGPWSNPMMAGPMAPYMMGMQPMMDPTMMMSQYGMMGGGMMANPTEVQREIVELKSVSLVPPAPGMQPPTMRVKPPGCKTIFVGGLAENTTEEILREIFEQCGEILIIRLNAKRFCHIRFMHEASVDAALYFSGYRMRIENKTDAPNTGRLHVDFAQARDDQYEWECKQRQLQREARHREKMEKERFRVPSPPPVPHYTESEAAAIAEKIKNEGFGEAVQVVITWLERGDCNKRNCSAFYSMIQSTNSHIRRLLQEKCNYEEELIKAKELMKARIQTILLQYAQIERVFTAASHKKVWDHFTKAQRKNIEMWAKQAAEIKSVELEEHLNIGADDEMDVSSDEDGAPKKKFKNETNILKEENDGLKCQVEAYKNEIDLVKMELKAEIDAKEAKLQVSQQTVQTLQKKLFELSSTKGVDEEKIRKLKSELAKAKEVSSAGSAGGTAGEVSTSASAPSTSSSPPPSEAASPLLPDRQARLIGMICMFLHVHPFGASVDYIWSYLDKLEPNIRNSDIESVLYGFPSMFEQELTGIGANVERKWVLKLFNEKTSEPVLSLIEPVVTT